MTAIRRDDDTPDGPEFTVGPDDWDRPTLAGADARESDNEGDPHGDGTRHPNQLAAIPFAN